ncbi:competence type IV pilus major pilin ComGC [Globicatella sulfidifaciens]|uniref:Prepilin-type N-terminal cleavage/methylation domain-containing protein n=1 Tax=Globicatella sulfidifaciens TaxID=136093 RepID=A0A7X8C553_9LACT|nr:competence type IV pilus major pilin ComGC [Globicatella sulfidifaciens]NLJ19088.1 prepilin-type N-terminal cleavage/methylation domain-containing protein [Globicatella sulfidifaciens]
MKRKIIKHFSNRKGFTLLEMLIVLIIVGLLMAIIIPNVSGQKERIETQATENIAEIVETQVNTYQLVEKSDDATLTLLVSEGYLTQKQADEAERLLGLSPDAVITVPISSNSGQ